MNAGKSQRGVGADGWAGRAAPAQGGVCKNCELNHVSCIYISGSVRFMLAGASVSVAESEQEEVTEVDY